ncbi:MAG: GNAT family acetyltransferase [Alphaproteobacteria bacterium]|jgi:ribosomal protein S18 acetylase RimI-like enzyme
MYLRDATQSDRDQVVALWRSAGLVVDHNPPHEDFDRALSQPQSAVLVGEEDNKIVAACMVGDDGHRGWVYYFGVDPSRKGQGLGREMMNAASAWFSGRGLRKAQLLVRPNNQKVIGFYESIDWTEEPRSIFAKWIQPKFSEKT